MKPLDERKRELLLESDINRQVLQLECEQLRMQADHARHGFGPGRWKILASLAGILVAWKFKKIGGGVIKSSVGLIVLRKIWDRISAWRK